MPFSGIFCWWLFVDLVFCRRFAVLGWYKVDFVGFAAFREFSGLGLGFPELVSWLFDSVLLALLLFWS